MPFGGLPHPLDHTAFNTHRIAGSERRLIPVLRQHPSQCPGAGVGRRHPGDNQGHVGDLLERIGERPCGTKDVGSGERVVDKQNRIVGPHGQSFAQCFLGTCGAGT